MYSTVQCRHGDRQECDIRVMVLEERHDIAPHNVPFATLAYLRSPFLFYPQAEHIFCDICQVVFLCVSPTGGMPYFMGIYFFWCSLPRSGKAYF